MSLTERAESIFGEIQRKVGPLRAADVKAWLEDRLRNCVRISEQKTGADRDGWIEDAAFFTSAIALIDWTEAAKSDLQS